MIARSRISLALKLALVIAIGLASRLMSPHAPALVSKHLGDILWTTMFVLIVLIIRPRMPTPTAACIGLAFCAAIEFLKLYRAPWLDSVRSVPVAGFLLGRVFQWWNFVSYVIGALAAVLLLRNSPRFV